MQHQSLNQPGVQSQYRGFTPAYEPVGLVPSYYQRQETGPFQGSGGGTAGAGSYRLPHYQGNQPGHDQDLRSDSSRPSGGLLQNQAAGPQTLGQSLQPSFTAQAGPMSNMAQTGQTGTYHMAHYRGDQPGHDQALRSDSSQPGGGFGSGSSVQPSITAQTGQMPNMAQTGQMPNMAQTGQMPNMAQTGQTGTYQMPHYRGDQPGHDRYLRSDSSRPSGFGQQGFR